MFGCAHPAICGARIPFALPDALNVTVASAVNSTAEPSDSASVLDWERAVDTGVDNLDEYAMYAVWTLAGTDSDADGVPDGIDNCPGDPNADQSDLDQDGIGEICDATPISVPGLRSWGALALVILLVSSSLVMLGLPRRWPRPDRRAPR